MMHAENRQTQLDTATIRPFQPGDESAFRALNEEWITQHFRIEEKDRQTFADPQRTIVDPGGQILFAVVDGECVGCCALVPMKDREFELAKMAVSPRFHGRGIGKRLLSAAIDAGKAAGARRLYLETNHKLTPAIRLYESFGFRHVAPEKLTPSPYSRTDVFMELHLA